MTINSISPSSIPTIPTINDLLNEVPNLDYVIKQPDDLYTEIFLRLDNTHSVFPILAKHALIHLVGLNQQDASWGYTTVDSLAEIDLHKDIESIKHTGDQNMQGWVGEMITDFIVRHFLYKQQQYLTYGWYDLEPPKGDVNNHGLDIIIAYELTTNNLGHTSGEIKTYTDLSAGKSAAYQKLLEAHDKKRDSEIRRALNALFRTKQNVIPANAALGAMSNERSFWPCILHCSTKEFKRENTFEDLPDKFTGCVYPRQMIGLQVSIQNFDDFFLEFIKQMHIQADIWLLQAQMVVSNV